MRTYLHLFPRGWLSAIEAVDLACAVFQAGLQLRDSAGLSPASPLLPVTSGTTGTLIGLWDCDEVFYHAKWRDKGQI